MRRRLVVDVHAGVFGAQRDGFADQYGARFGSSLGVGFSFILRPAEKGIVLVGKASRFSADGSPDLDNGRGSYSYFHWLYNAGLRYDFPISEQYKIGVGAGAAFLNSREEGEETSFGPDGAITLSYRRSTIGLGPWIGMRLERAISQSGFSLFGAARQNYAFTLDLEEAIREDQNTFVNVGGMTAQLGVQYLLPI